MSPRTSLSPTDAPDDARDRGHGTDAGRFRAMVAGAFSRLRPRLEARAAVITGHREDAQDVLQDVFLRLWSRPVLSRPDTQEGADALAMRAVHNAAIDAVRRRAVRRQQPLPDDEHGLAEASGAQDPTEGADAVSDTYLRVRAIIDSRLTPRQRQVMDLREIRGMDFSQIAAITGLTEANVRQILSRSRRTVRDVYFQLYGPPES